MDDCGRNHDGCHGAVAIALSKTYLYAELVGNAADDLKANRVRNRECRNRWLRQHLVQAVHLLWSNACSVIEDRDRIVAGCRVCCTGDVDGGSWRRVLSGVLHELCEKVSHFARLRASNVGFVERNWNDSLVVLDLANGDTENFAKWNCWAVALGGLCVGENKQALCIAMHASSEVIYSVQQ